MSRPEFAAVRMMGRCANGNEADGGRLYHALQREEYGFLWGAACGAMPGRRSAGWSDFPETIKDVTQVTCPRCRKALRKYGINIGN